MKTPLNDPNSSQIITADSLKKWEPSKKYVKNKAKPNNRM